MTSGNGKATVAVADPPRAHSPIFVGTNLALNIALSISIVLLNKTAYSRYGFPNLTMTFIHFVFTTIGMLICRALGRFEPASVPILKMLPTAVTFCGFVVLTNLSLQINTVGTYQIIKSLTTPCIMVLQAFFYGRKFSARVIASVVPIIAGVYLNCHYDLRFTQIGFFFAGFGVLITSIYQVWVNEKQKEFKISSMQLLYYQAPLSAFILIFFIPFFEPVIGPGSFLGGKWSFETLVLVFMTGVVAFAINLSIFWIIGNTSPLTYNMVGHAKFCLTLIGGYILFQDPLQLKQILGILITFSGIVYYTYVRMQEQKAEASKALVAPLDSSQKSNP